MPEKIVPGKNPNTPENWNARWADLGMIQLKDEWVTQRIQKVASLIPPNVEVLDLASGAGIIQRYLPIGCEYTPVDFSDEALKLAGGKAVLCPCTSVPLPPKEYHTVLAMEILEHLDHEADLITQAMALAYHQVIFTVPDNRLTPQEFPYHVRTYTHDSLTALLEQYANMATAKYSPYGPFHDIIIHTTPGTLIAQCTLQ